jgi:hypothetical protein
LLAKRQRIRMAFRLQLRGKTNRMAHPLIRGALRFRLYS